jgi:hypothetical protein
MEELRDIKGLDAISWYPLAPGWLLLLAAGLLLILLIMRWRRVKPVTTPTIPWQTAALSEWQQLHQIESPRQQLEAVAVLLRRVAIQRYGRENCAGLVGYDWLHWLTTHDPQQFDWVAEAQILIKLPYMPPSAEIDQLQLNQLINAVKAWLN